MRRRGSLPVRPTLPAQNAMREQHFDLDRGHVELHQLLKLCGVVTSGGEGKALVAAGAVRVDGAVESRKTRKLTGGEVVEVDGERIVVVAPAG